MSHCYPSPRTGHSATSGFDRNEQPPPSQPPQPYAANQPPHAAYQPPQPYAAPQYPPQQQPYQQYPPRPPPYGGYQAYEPPQYGRYSQQQPAQYAGNQSTGQYGQSHAQYGGTQLPVEHVDHRQTPQTTATSTHAPQPLQIEATRENDAAFECAARWRLVRRIEAEIEEFARNPDAPKPRLTKEEYAWLSGSAVHEEVIEKFRSTMEKLKARREALAPAPQTTPASTPETSAPATSAASMPVPSTPAPATSATTRPAPSVSVKSVHDEPTVPRQPSNESSDIIPEFHELQVKQSNESISTQTDHINQAEINQAIRAGPRTSEYDKLLQRYRWLLPPPNSFFFSGRKKVLEFLQAFDHWIDAAETQPGLATHVEVPPHAEQLRERLSVAYGPETSQSIESSAIDVPQ